MSFLSLGLDPTDGVGEIEDEDMGMGMGAKAETGGNVNSVSGLGPSLHLAEVEQCMGINLVLPPHLCPHPPSGNRQGFGIPGQI
jgi:hypothetical protein